MTMTAFDGTVTTTADSLAQRMVVYDRLRATAALQEKMEGLIGSDSARHWERRLALCQRESQLEVDRASVRATLNRTEGTGDGGPVPADDEDEEDEI
mmetsp:Transcript_47978/g.65327  ORF Transcript_47978/g.65327 Transcript_47978/m.65327 type:complete len:97 (+) Transcript_47978:3-293(+)